MLRYNHPELSILHKWVHVTAVTFYHQTIMMPKHSVFVAIGNICEEFTNDLKHVSNGIILGYHAKKRTYGCKLIIFAKDRITDKSIVYSLIKICSIADMEILGYFLNGMSEFLHKYYYKPSSCDSDSQWNPSMWLIQHINGYTQSLNRWL